MPGVSSPPSLSRLGSPHWGLSPNPNLAQGCCSRCSGELLSQVDTLLFWGPSVWVLCCSQAPLLFLVLVAPCCSLGQIPYSTDPCHEPIGRGQPVLKVLGGLGQSFCRGTSGGTGWGETDRWATCGDRRGQPGQGWADLSEPRM